MKHSFLFLTCQCDFKILREIIVNILTVFLHLPLIEKLYPKSVELLFFDLPVMSWHIIREKKHHYLPKNLPNLICLWWNRYTNLLDTPYSKSIFDILCVCEILFGFAFSKNCSSHPWYRFFSSGTYYFAKMMWSFVHRT